MALFENREAEQDLARTLMGSFKVARTTGLKRKLSRWIGELRAPSSMISEMEEEVTDGEQDLLAANVANHEGE